MYLRVISILPEKYDSRIVFSILGKDNRLIECVDFEYSKAPMCSEFPDRIGAFFVSILSRFLALLVPASFSVRLCGRFFLRYRAMPSRDRWQYQ